VDVLLGLWLLVSAIAWPQPALQTANSIIVGVLVIVAAGVAAFAMPEARFANTALGLWLFLSALVVLGRSDAAIWNDIVVGGLLVGLSFLPGTARVSGVWARHAES
jgi:hypothetical protein